MGNKLSYQIRLPQSLTHAKELLRGRTRDNKVLGKVNAAYAIETADEWLPRLGVEASNDGTDKVWAESAFVERRRDEVSEGGGSNLALLTQAIHVDLVAEQVADGADIGSEAREAHKDVAVAEDLGEVVGDGQGLHAETEIAGDGYAVLADHGNAGAAV